MRRWNAILGLGAALLLAALSLAPAFYPSLTSTGFGDWEQIHHNWEVGVEALRAHGEWPLWDPHRCGGVTMLGNPESQHFTPFFFLSFLLSSTLALKVTLLLHAWLGLVGAFLLARRAHALSRAASAVAAIGFAFNGFFAWQMAGGHFPFVSFYFAPWLLLAWRRSVVDLRYAAAVAGLLALSVAEGGTYPFPYFLLLLAFDALLIAAPALDGSELPGRAEAPRGSKARLGGLLKAGLAAGLLTFLLSAVRLLPILRTLLLYPRPTHSIDHLTVLELIENWTRYDFPWSRPGHAYVWNEYSAFIGWPLLLLGLAGLLLALRRRRLGLPLALLFFGALMLGHRGPLSPWALLHHLPIYGSLRVPSRFSVLATLYLALLAGLALDALRQFARRLSQRWSPGGIGRAPRLLGGLALGLVVLAATAPALIYHGVTHHRWEGPPIEGPRAERFHLVHGSGASLPSRNLGSTHCYDGAMRWTVAPGLWTGDLPQARVIRGRGRLLSAWRSNHSVHAEVEMETEGRLVFNQNFHPDWKPEGEGEVIEDGGRLAVELPPGRHSLHVRYLPATLCYAGALSLLGLLLCALLLRIRR